MFNTDWKKLNSHQLGRYAEQLAGMAFLSYGLDVYPTVVDDHGVDMVIKDKKGRFTEIQIKSLYKSNYTFIQKRHMDVNNPDYYVCLLRFTDGKAPDIYLIPATTWRNPEGCFCYRAYDKESQTSKPEYGITLSKKNQHILNKFCFEKMIEQMW